MTVPPFAVRLASQRVRSDVLQCAGFAFGFSELEQALRFLLGR